jgi:hypothetical protein
MVEKWPWDCTSHTGSGEQLRAVLPSLGSSGVIAHWAELADSLCLQPYRAPWPHRVALDIPGRQDPCVLHLEFSWPLRRDLQHHGSFSLGIVYWVQVSLSQKAPAPVMRELCPSILWPSLVFPPLCALSSGSFVDLCGSYCSLLLA